MDDARRDLLEANVISNKLRYSRRDRDLENGGYIYITYTLSQHATRSVCVCVCVTNKFLRSRTSAGFYLGKGVEHDTPNVSRAVLAGNANIELRGRHAFFNSTYLDLAAIESQNSSAGCRLSDMIVEVAESCERVVKWKQNCAQTRSFRAWYVDVIACKRAIRDARSDVANNKKKEG